MSSAHRTALELQLWEQKKMNWRFIFYLLKLFQGRHELDWGCFWRVCTWSSPFRGCRTHTAVRGTSSDYSVSSNLKKKTETLGYQKILTRGLWNLCIYNILIILTCKMSVVNFTCWNKKNMLGKQILKFAYWSVISAFGLTLYFSPRCRSTL